MTYLICYDIREPKRLHKVASVLENHGIRVQKSFFQCDLGDEHLKSLRYDLLKVIDMTSTPV